MKILLSNPPTKIKLNEKYEKYFVRAGSRWPHSGIKKIGTLPHYLPFPFFLSYAASLLIQEGFDVFVIDAVASDLDKEQFLSLVCKKNPDILFFEVATPTINYDLELIKEIKDLIKNCKIVVGGSHVSTFAKEILENCLQIDFCLIGEYELTLLELLECLKNNQSLKNINGIAFRENNTIVKTNNRELIEPLDLLPMPQRDIFPLSDKGNIYVYWDGFCQLYPAIQMQASRGCPYGCYFCLWPQVMYRSRKYRHFSAKRVVDEMQMVIDKYKAREIYFDDDDFTIDRKFVREVCEEILTRKLKIKWSCMGDAMNLDEKLIELMAQAGLIALKFGVETASKNVLENMGKPLNLEKVRKISDMLISFGIKTHATFTLGLINETKETIRDTIEFASKLNCDTIQVSIATPFPGTKFFEVAQKNNWLKEFKWEDFDGKTKEIIEIPTINSQKLENYRSKFIRIWLFSKILDIFWIVRQFKIVSRSIRYQGFKFYFKKIFAALRNELG